MRTRLQEFLVPEDATVLEALKAIDRSGNGLVLVCSDERSVLGTITDGDVRRALIAGHSLDTPGLSTIMHREFVHVGPDAGRAEVLDLMLARGLRHIVVVDDQKRLLGLHLLHELVGHRVVENWAVIMAGGKGLRLRPITEEIPKPMIEVAGRPILERLILHLVGHGFQRIFVSVNHLSHVIEDYFGDGAKLGCRIQYLRESEPLGSGGSLSLLPEEPSLPVMVMNGDLVTQADLGQMLDFHVERGLAATVGLRPHSIEFPFGVAEVTEDRLISLQEKPVQNALINAGIYVFSPEIVKRVPAAQQFPITDLIQGCLDEGLPVGAHVLEGYWTDVGRPEQLREAQGEL